MKFGYQLYSALTLCKDTAGMVDTLEKIAAVGYDGVEFCDYAGIPAAEMKALLTRLNLEGFNTHVNMERWLADPEGEIRYAADAGIPCVTISWVPPEMRDEKGYAQIKAMVPQLLKWCKQHGVQLMYHNHDFEFVKDTNGRYVLDDVLEAAPELSLELDTFWAFFAGVDPLTYMEGHKDKLGMLHIKDYEKLDGVPQAGGGEAPTFCAIGTGLMDNQSIVNWAKANDITWVCVDQDNSQIPELEAAKISIKSMREMQGK